MDCCLVTSLSSGGSTEWWKESLSEGRGRKCLFILLLAGREQGPEWQTHMDPWAMGTHVTLVQSLGKVRVDNQEHGSQGHGAGLLE